MPPAVFPDDFERGRKGAVDWPVTRAVAVTPSDSTQLSNGTPEVFPRALFVGTGGDLTVDMAETGTDIVFKNVQSGQIVPIRVKRVKLATTATDILALY